MIRKDQDEVVLPPLCTNIILEIDPTQNENLNQDLRSVLHNLKSRDGLQATDVDLQVDPPKETTDESANETEMEYVLNKKKIPLW
ncbi:hypothetical protein FGIG_01181 [Fasciola gigantica]|uniref:Uncharacterized protein n=1 Tax=Fasciola gigantica TaxID=46835 RepID=A0A504YSD7_FASGI|nr:hypothetical protein FGIG_01181 [Fasciola gigantica]